MNSLLFIIGIVLPVFYKILTSRTPLDAIAYIVFYTGWHGTFIFIILKI